MQNKSKRVKTVDAASDAAMTGYVTPTAVARFYNVCRHTITRWRGMGCPCIPVVKTTGKGAHYRYNLAAVQAWLDARATSGKELGA